MKKLTQMEGIYLYNIFVIGRRKYRSIKNNLNELNKDKIILN